MLKKILVANRGEISRRVMRSAKRMGMATVAVYSEADSQALHVEEADEAVLLGPAPAGESYLNIEALLQAIAQTGADVVHPGYGFLSENAAFVRALEERGIAFAGPGLSAIEVMGDKITAREAAERAGVNVIPGISTAAVDVDAAQTMAAQIGFPVMLKAAAGGGGKGMRVVHRPEDLPDAFAMASSEAGRSFGDARMFVERFIDKPRHIEVQLIADSHGTVVALGERECSLQRRHQKVIEEAPSPVLRPEVRQQLLYQSCLLAKAVGYHSAGTVEFIVDQQQNFYFLEMNTRLQVEHPVTEMVHGNIDLVEWMIRVADGQKLPKELTKLQAKGHAIEARLYAESPEKGFVPSAGRLSVYQPPAMTEYLRLDDGVSEGRTIPIHYDPMIGKLVAYGQDRAEALARLTQAISAFRIAGIDNNLLFLEHLLRDPKVVAADMHTRMLDDMYHEDAAFEVPGDTAVYAALCTLALLSDANSRDTLYHPDDFGDGQTLVAFVAHEQRWQAYHFVIALTANGQYSIVAAQETTAPRVTMYEGGVAQGLGYVVFQDQSNTNQGANVQDVRHCVRMNRPQPSFYSVEWQGRRLQAVVRPARLAVIQQKMPVPSDGSDVPHLALNMAGVLLRVHVSVGDSVKRGQPLAVVEAMKMENLLVAPRDTKITSIDAEEGANLSVGAVLMRFAD